MLKIGHEVVRPGRYDSRDESLHIGIPQELVSESIGSGQEVGIIQANEPAPLLEGQDIGQEEGGATDKESENSDDAEDD